MTEPDLDGSLVLGDGRSLSYCEWGDPAGPPVVLFHGTPGSRYFAPQPEVTRELGARLISFDRPGYGGSTRREGRAVADTPADVAQLADAIGLECFAVIGVSAGGGHALACAITMPERVRGVALVSAPGPIDEVPGAFEALADHYRPTAGVALEEPARAARRVVRALESFVAEPTSYLGGGAPADRELARDPEHRSMLERDVTEAFRHDAGGMADDLVALWRPWGFSIAAAPPGIWVWHGEQDTRAAPDFRYLTGTLPGCRTHVWPDQGHLGVVLGWRDVLGPLVGETY